jgi:hypothetical protein
MFVLLFALLFNVVTATPSSGFQATVTAAGVNKISSFVVPLIDDLVKNKTITLPNVHIDTHVAEPIGHITIDLTNIQISGLSLAALPVNVLPPSSFLLALDDLSLILNMDYKWRKVHWPHASDHGTVNVVPQDVTGSIAVGVVSNNSRPLLDNVKTSLTFGSFNIKFHGKVAWLYNLLMKTLKGKITDAISNAFSGLISKTVQKMNANFSKMQVHKTIGGGKSKIIVDLSFIHADVKPVNSSIVKSAQGNYMSFGLAMDVISSTTSKSCDYPEQAALPEQAPIGLGDTDLVQLVLGQRFFNCALEALNSQHALDFLLINEKLPPMLQSMGFLNTTKWCKSSPTLCQKYPNMLMQMEGTPHVNPEVNCSKIQGCTLHYPLVLNTSVVNSGTNISSHVFTLGLDLAFGGNLHINNTGNVTVLANVTSCKISVSVYDDPIPVNAESIQSKANLISFLAKNLLNTVLKNGFPLPNAPGLIKLVDAQLAVEDGYLTIASSIELG